MTTHSHLVLGLKDESSYTSAPPLGIHGPLPGELYLFFFFTFYSFVSDFPPHSKAKKRSHTDGDGGEFHRLL